MGIIEQFTGENTLLDTRLGEIVLKPNVSSGLDLWITFIFDRQSSKYRKVKIQFSSVKKFDFFHTEDYEFYNVEAFKLLNINSEVYLSLDPDQTEVGPSDEDKDCVLCSSARVVKEWPR